MREEDDSPTLILLILLIELFGSHNQTKDIDFPKESSWTFLFDRQIMLAIGIYAGCMTYEGNSAFIPIPPVWLLLLVLLI